MNRRSRQGRVSRPETLEVRALLSAISLQPDIVQTELPADAIRFPSVIADVLANDTGTGLRISDTSVPNSGTLQLMVGGGEGGRDVLKYVPGPDFRGRDFFDYTVTDALGQSAVQQVEVHYSQDSSPYIYQLLTIDELSAKAGLPQPLKSTEGVPAVQVAYNGNLPANVGVLLSWAPLSGGFSGLQFPGKFTIDTTPDSAQFSAFPGGTAWIYGSVKGVNAILADTVYVPERGFSAAEGVRLGIHTYFYSSIGVNVGTESSSLLIRVQEQELAPQVLDDVFTVRSSKEVSFLDVLNNDTSGVSSDVMELVDVQLGGHSSALLSVDPGTQQLVYQPPVGFMGTDVIAYTVRNSEGVEAQGRVEVNVMPPILALLSTASNSTMLEVLNAETMGTISQFEVFSRAAADSIVEVADLDADGFMEIVVLQTGGERRMRAFNVYGGMLTDTVMSPFGRRLNGPMDLSIGDLDDDGRAEMVLAASTTRGYELRVVDSATGQIEMSMTMRGMTGTPQIAINEESDEVVVLGRTSSGGVVMAMMDMDSASPQQVTRRTLISDREVRNLQRQNGVITSLTLSTTDLDGNGTTEAVVGMTFRNGVARVMTAGSTGLPQTMMQSKVSSGTRSLILPGSSLFSDNGATVGWWSTSSVGMLNAVGPSLLRRRIIGVALG